MIIICRDTGPLGTDIITLHTYYASLLNNMDLVRILLFSLPNISRVIRASLNSRENNDFTASADQKVLQVMWGGVGSECVLLKPGERCKVDICLPRTVSLVIHQNTATQYRDIENTIFAILTQHQARILQRTGSLVR